MAGQSATTTFLHLEHVREQIEVTVDAPAHCDHVLNIREQQGCHLCVFLADPQLRQLLGAINERLGLVSVAQYPGECEKVATTACTCIHHAGDNERCVVHSAGVEVAND